MQRWRDPRWQGVAILAVTETVSWGVLYYAFSVFLVPMEQELMVSRAESSVVFSVAVVMRGLASPFAGAWVDRRGVRSLMTLGSVAGVLLTFAWSWVHTLLQLHLVFAGIGAVTAMVLYEPAFAAVAMWMRGRDRTRAVLWITLSAGFASTIFLPLAATLIDVFGWREALRVLALVLLVFTVAPHALLREPGSRSRSAPGGPAAAAVVARGNEAHRDAGGQPLHDEVSVTARAAMRQPTFWWMTLAFACGRVPIVAVTTHLPALLVERGETAILAATITGGIGALSVTGRILLAVASRWSSFERLLAAVYALQAAAVLVLAFVPGRAAVMVFVVAFGLGFGATTITKPVMVAQRYGPAAYGSIAGVIAAVTTLSEAASPALTGIARDLSNGYQLPMLGLAGVLLVGSYAAGRCRAAPPAAVASTA